MKRSNAIGASVTELRRLVRSGVLAGTILILLVSLPAFVPPLAHLLRPRTGCISMVNCSWETIKGVIWHLRWAAAAIGAITILLGWMLALRTRGWCENESTGQIDLARPHTASGADCASDTDSPQPSGMSAKEIASNLRGTWTPEASGCAYSTPQRRVRITLETNGDWDALRYERRDPYADCEEFAHDLLAIVGDDLTARDQLALIRALAERLTAWQARRGCEDDPVRHCLEELLSKHRKGTVL